MTNKNEPRIESLEKQREILRGYIQAKLESDDDYHAIMDAAADIREIDVELRLLRNE